MMNNGVLLFICPCSLSNARNGRNARFLVRFAAVTAIMLDTECACPAGDPFIVIGCRGRKVLGLPDRHFVQAIC